MVLIIAQKHKDAVWLSHIFYYMKILSYPCTPSEALNEISALYNAVIINEPNDLPDTADFIMKLRALAPAPIFAIANEPKKCRCPYLFDKVFRNAILSGKLVTQIWKYQYANNMPMIGQYKFGGVDVCCNTQTPTFCVNYVELTKTERMIVAYLSVAHSEQQTPKDITKYAFPYGKNPSISCIRTHISNINKKFTESTGATIIACNPGTGYYMLAYFNRKVKPRKKDKTSHIVW